MRRESIKTVISNILSLADSQDTDLFCFAPQELGADTLTSADADAFAKAFIQAAEDAHSDFWNDYPHAFGKPTAYIESGNLWLDIVTEPIAKP